LDEVQIFSVGIDIVNGISTNMSPTSCCIDLGSCTLIDFKFLNDETLVVLSNSQGKLMAMTQKLPLKLELTNKRQFATSDMRTLAATRVLI
jgi:hypothetical protein